ncbi:MAG: hypothetical protein ACLU0O_12875 [Collinsella sp.]
MLVMFVLTLLLNLRAVRRTNSSSLWVPSVATRASRHATLDRDCHLLGVALVGVAYYRLLRDGFR